VFGDNKAITKAPFIIGSTTLTDGRLIKLRYDVNTELCDQFKFGIKTDSNQQWHLVSMNLLLDVSDLPVLNQSTRIQQGQPR
jgi:tRNA splicing endonuclease